MTPPLDARERIQLAARFEELGPDAPTLCEGWTTFDLAAHLNVRERSPVAGPGILLGDRVPALGRVTEQAMAREKTRGWEAVTERVRTGPPLGIFRVPILRQRLNLIEFTIHHEDVRRANGGEPRDDIDDLQDALWALLRTLGSVLFRGVTKPYGVELARPEGAVVVARPGDPVARVAGDPLELVLFAYGRAGAARVALDGPPAAVDALRAARLGI